VGRQRALLLLLLLLLARVGGLLLLGWLLDRLLLGRGRRLGRGLGRLGLLELELQRGARRRRRRHGARFVASRSPSSAPAAGDTTTTTTTTTHVVRGRPPRYLCRRGPQRRLPEQRPPAPSVPVRPRSGPLPCK
jgi:hypothetical protein